MMSTSESRIIKYSSILNSFAIKTLDGKILHCPVNIHHRRIRNNFMIKFQVAQLKTLVEPLNCYFQLIINSELHVKKSLK